jgi:transcriptional regulator with XRE-family HTH domain
MSRWEDAIGPKIRTARLRANMSQERLAEKAGLAAGYISQIETGRKTPSAKAISRISEALQVDMAEFLMRDRDIPSEKDALISRIVRLLETRSEADLEFAYHILARMFEHFTSYEGESMGL